ncbi:hypothetical protein BJF89_13685 [Corynebacterium sp. CNJ-954]|nr:hypothetical protein BJF89_13685 [Corynebacterium sp. CNJ-954]
MANDQYMTVKQIAEWLCCSEKTVNRRLDDGTWLYLQPAGPRGTRMVRRSEILKSEKRGLLS